MSTVVLVLTAALCAALIATEHMLLARALSHNETARRVIGVGTVLACAAVPVVTGVMAWQPFAYTCALFVVAGSVMLVFDWVETAQTRGRIAERERDEITATRGS